MTRAAARLHLSVSAASRALARSRAAFNDPLLVRQGRNVVITPRGEELRERIGPLLAGIEELFETPPLFDPSTIRGTFAVRANEAVLATGAAGFLALTRAEAPNATVKFDMETMDDFAALRSGAAALAIGSYSSLPADINTAHLVDERLVAAVRSGHPCLETRVTSRRFAALDQVVVSRRGIERGVTDDELARQGLRRNVVAVVPSFTAALAMAAQSDHVAIVPQRLASLFSRGAGLELFEIPVVTPTVSVAQIWHRRLDVDSSHEWLRSCVERIVPDS